MLICAFGSTQAQSIYSFGFDGSTAYATGGWERTNQSTTPGVSPALWAIASYTPVTVVITATEDNQNPFNDVVYTNGQTSPAPFGQSGGVNSFGLVNFRSTTGPGTDVISNWLISPVVTVENGDVVSFWTRKGTAGSRDFADRLELRMSTGATHTNPAGGPANTGSFNTLGVTVNPNLATGFVYPKTWTQYSFTVSGLNGPTAVKFGFRYFVTSAGPSGANSDLIGIDTFSVNRNLSTSDFFAKNFSVFPNPSTGIVNISSKNNNAIDVVQVTDLNGRIVKTNNMNGVSDAQINISDLTSGVYFVNIKTDAGSGTTKIVKN